MLVPQIRWSSPFLWGLRTPLIAVYSPVHPYSLPAFSFGEVLVDGLRHPTPPFAEAVL